MIDKIRTADQRRVGLLNSVGDRFRALPKWHP